jgi:hypothetical protein
MVTKNSENFSSLLRNTRKINQTFKMTNYVRKPPVATRRNPTNINTNQMFYLIKTVITEILLSKRPID